MQRIGWVMVAGLAFAPAADAADVRVVNERGIPQAAKWTGDAEAPRFLTDADGWIREVEPGTTLRVTRSTLDGAQYPCNKYPGGAPEGPNGVSFTVTEAGGTITLPNATGPSYQPEQNDAERWIVGQINARRAAKGLPALRVSAILTRTADAVARRQAAEQLSFPPPFCPAVVADWGFPSTGGAAFNIGGLDAAGSDPRKAWAHWSDGSLRETRGTLGNWNAVGVGDGSGAWAAYFANCPDGLDARCEMTADQGDPNIVLPGPAQPPPVSGLPNPAAGDGGAAVMGALTVAPKQRGKGVRLSVQVGRDKSVVAVRVKRGSKLVGKLLKRDLAAGKHTLGVRLNHSGKKLLKAKKALSLTVEVVVDPPAGESASAMRRIKLRR